MIATVIPSIRTPRGITGFDYAIPEGIEIRTGDLVRIPFRKRELVGIVSGIQSTTEIKTGLKEIIGSFEDLHLGEIGLHLLLQTSERSFSSPATVLHAWLGTLPKKASKDKKEQSAEQTASPHIKKDDYGTLFLKDRLNHPSGIVAIAKKALEDHKRVLILSPWSARAEQIARLFDIHALTSEIAAGKRFKLWKAFLNGESRILVSTRIGIWCGISADLIIIDEPENDDHKQDELAPRYDARWVAAYLQSKGTNVALIGCTPRLANIAMKDIVSEKDIPDLSAAVSYVDTHYADWSDLPGVQGRALLLLEEAVRDQRPCFIIHPIHGEQARLRCKDCGWSATCEVCGSSTLVQTGKLHCRRCRHQMPIVLECPSCHGTTFANSKPGKLRLETAIQTKGFEHISVLAIGEWNSLSTLPQNSFVLLTDLSLLPGAREDLRKSEQLIIAWRRLVDVCGAAKASLIVQGDPSTLTQAKEWLSAEGCLKAFGKELEERKTFGLPPAARLVKLIFRGNEQHAQRILERIARDIPRDSDLRISGPFAVQYRPSHREARWIGHLSAPLSTQLQDLIRTLAPIAQETDTLIDLDPIAFFE